MSSGKADVLILDEANVALACGLFPVGRLLALIRDRECHPAMLNDVLTLPLPPSWHKLFTRRRDQGQAEDWSARLRG